MCFLSSKSRTAFPAQYFGAFLCAWGIILSTPWGPGMTPSSIPNNQNPKLRATGASNVHRQAGAGATARAGLRICMLQLVYSRRKKCATRSKVKKKKTCKSDYGGSDRQVEMVAFFECVYHRPTTRTSTTKTQVPSPQKAQAPSQQMGTGSLWVGECKAIGALARWPLAVFYLGLLWYLI